MVGSHLTLVLLCILGIASARIEDVKQLRDINVEEINTDNYQRMMKMRHLAIEFFDYYENITATDLILPGTRLPNLQDLQCLAEVAQLTQALQSGSLWALRMIDSWGRLPAGLLYGNTRDLGNFDECIRVNQEIALTGQTIRGKYCFANLVSVSLLRVRTAVCFPSACTADHMDTLLRQLYQRLLNIELNANSRLVDESTCQTSEKEPLDGLAIFTVTLIGVLLGILLLCTLYDYFLCEDQKNMPVIVKIFSARVNSRELFRIVDSKTNPNVIDCLHGIRCMSLIWVVFGHDYALVAVGPNINIVDFLPWMKSAFSMFIVHGLFAVDTFFFLSGLLVVLVAMRAVEKSKGRINVPLMYLHRYLRLTPMVGLAICAYMSILPILGTGPLFKSFAATNSNSCEETWFWTLLYLQNYVVPEKLCLEHSWYLSVDMQMYLFAPFLIMALYKWGKKAVAVIVVLTLLLAGCLFSMMVIKGYSINSANHMDKIYFATHTRASPWAIGLLFGYFLHVNRGKSFKLNQLTVWAGWISCLALIFSSLFGLYPYAANGYSLPILNEAFYVTLTRISWPMALVWVVFACKYGYGGLANSFLSSPLWQPLSKLSYSAYIWHILIEQFNTYTSRTNTYFSDYQVMLRFWSDFGFSVLLAYGMYILVEAPTGGLQTWLLPSGKSKAKPKTLAAPSKANEEASAPELEPKAVTVT
ncbi:nose resistant to fluoxetine protein 6-like [Drosophila nasuta]|uniref:nose resistant to fluoxetine protein 6-like n=1 Tax=Drosophila nasuta TaxID=42062 RepID=UPI00295E9F7A|nr:nose resistant to fluoxetine protein 6-like [Drosophila nasuta]